MRLDEKVGTADIFVSVYTAGAEDYDEDTDTTQFPVNMKLIAGFDYGSLDWDSAVHLLERVNGDLGENRFSIVDQPYSESIFIVKVEGGN